MDKAKFSPTASAGQSDLPQHQQLECDYDSNPTVLYQAIEAKQWDYTVSLFEDDKCRNQSATWVVRKETNGQLRWRLLPLHAAVIFGSPLRLVECLLADYPTAAQCKDDQGMLPLHLAFRNEGAASWEIIDELLTAYPSAIFVKDRKGRTPLECGIQLASSSSSATSINSAPEHSKAFKSVVSVLDLYSQIVISGERQKAQNNIRKQVENKIVHIQESHVQSMENLKEEWQQEQEDTKEQLIELRRQNEALESRIESQNITIEALEQIETDLKANLEQSNTNLHETAKKAKEPSHKDRMTHDLLRSVVGDLVLQQKEYHQKFSRLMLQYQKLVDERKQIQAVFVKDSKKSLSDESTLIEEFQTWLAVKEKELKGQTTAFDCHSTQDEKKTDETNR